MRDIERIRSQVPKIFFETNFGQSSYEVATGNGTVRNFPAYTLTRDAFSLLVMGFTGKAAIQWKLRYIDAFNALESSVQTSQSELAREAGYRQGMDEGRASVLPRLREEHEAGYLSGLAEGQKYRRQHDGLALLTRALQYKDKGLNQCEIARLLGIRKQRVSELMARARELGGRA